MRKYNVSFLLFLLCVVAVAQPVHIPDSNLRRVIADHLNVPHTAAISQEDMRRLIHVSVWNHSLGIQDLTGLEYATNLVALDIDGQPIPDFTPIANLLQLHHLKLYGIYNLDITQLANLTNLKLLVIASSNVDDIAPLANMTELEELHLNYNYITDVSPLAGLTNLDVLVIHGNRIEDHSPLDGLALSRFVYDQECQMPPLPLDTRIDNTSYPAIFARWHGWHWPPVSNRPNLSFAENIALHDLRFAGKMFGLDNQKLTSGFKVRGDLELAVAQRNELQSLNPNMIHLMDVIMRTAPLDWYPPDSDYWLKGRDGNMFIEYFEGVPALAGYLDFTKPMVQDIIVEQAIAVDKCGLYDGIMFDYWSDTWPVLGGWDGIGYYYPYTAEEEHLARLAIVKRIREATRPNFLIMGNTNIATIPVTGPYVNGAFMETVVPGAHTPEEASRHLSWIEKSLRWFEEHLREPRINGLEGWTIPTEALDSLNNLRWMRAITTLSLTHSDGYVAFYSIAHGGHNWYDFWDADLGRPVGGKGQLYQNIDGLYIREFTNGWAVYNHSGAPQVITLPEEVQGAASGLKATEHALPNLDGEMYLRIKPVNPADVNGDGVVNILDLTLVAQAIGTRGAQGDINGDGVVNVFDLVQVAGAIGGGGAAPSTSSVDQSIISAADVDRWLAQAQGLGVGDANFQRGIRFLQQLLAALTPKETSLLPNYPNPFNPETWIPYHLTREAEVTITIYNTKGTQVRRLALGNQAAGYYAARGKAAYWDGRNERGEAVASGIYFYQFRAGDYVASRRMVIVK